AAVTYSDSLFADTDCTVSFGTRVRGSGDDERVRLWLATPLLLSPGETDWLRIRLDSLPQRYEVRHITGEIRIDPSFVAFDRSINRNDDVLSPDAELRVRFLTDRAEFEILRATPFDRTGEMFSVGLTALTGGPECRAVSLDSMQLVGPGGINSTATGKVCINPSCRHPDGLYALSRPALKVHPHPVTQQSGVTVILPREEEIRISVVDLFGEERRHIASGRYAEGTHHCMLPVEGLAAGVYILRLEWQGGMSHTRIVVAR
ncbi:MAG: T9SS type A sorting domain-containing protein, partial [Bacteroidetes bacterium]|nr:T9SS type A sorting domain-containing protein [Bacteroidota bacterium]